MSNSSIRQTFVVFAHDPPRNRLPFGLETRNAERAMLPFCKDFPTGLVKRAFRRPLTSVVETKFLEAAAARVSKFLGSTSLLKGVLNAAAVQE